MKFWSNYKSFYSRKCIWKHCLQNGGHFVGGDTWVKVSLWGCGHLTVLSILLYYRCFPIWFMESCCIWNLLLCEENFCFRLYRNCNVKFLHFFGLSFDLMIYCHVMCFRGSSVFVGSFSDAFSHARGKISQLTHVYKHLPRDACCLIQVLSIKFLSTFATPSSRGSVGKQVLYLMTISCHFSSCCCSGTSAQKI